MPLIIDEIWCFMYTFEVAREIFCIFIWNFVKIINVFLTPLGKGVFRVVIHIKLCNLFHGKGRKKPMAWNKLHR